MNWLEMRVRHGIRPLLPVLMLVILSHHLPTLEGMMMGPPPEILFDFEIDDTFLKHGSLSVKQYERRKIRVYMHVLRTHLLHPSCSKSVLQNACLYPLSRKKPAERYGGASIHWIACSPSLPSRGLPLPGSCAQ
jgi:hypothetical protein